MASTGGVGSEAQRVLAFWFGPLDPQGRASASASARWWKKDATFDEEIRTSFGGLHAQLAGGECSDWLATPRGRMAYVIVLDQFSRNMFRGSGQSFATDERALVAVEEGIALGHDRALAFDERGFFYMPFMHSEKLDKQDRAVALFSAWREELQGAEREHVAGMVRYAERHRDIISRFGRFPHRNALLGRASTGEEQAFLAQPGSSF